MKQQLPTTLYHYLPNFNKEISKAYTPLGIRNLFAKAVEEKGGDIQAVFDDKHKYKSLIELYHAGFLALAIKKWIKREFVLYPSDSPDIYFLDTNTDEAFPVEVMELYSFVNKDNFDGDYEKLAKHVFETKGNISFPSCHLLITSRINADNFNISKFCEEIQKFKWNFERIWLCLHRSKNKDWTFFEIFPCSDFVLVGAIDYNLDKDKELLY